MTVTMGSTEADERVDRYWPRALTRFFLWCAGSDPALLDTRIEYYRAAGVGIFILLIATLAAVTFSLYIDVVSGGFSPWYLPFALFWGVIVFFVDRSIVVDPSYGNLSRAERRFPQRRASIASPWPPRGPQDAEPDGAWRVPIGGGNSGRAARPVMYFARIGMAILVALLIAEVIVLLIFQPEIQKELARESQASYETAVTVLADTKIEGKQRQLDDLAVREAASDVRIATAKAAVAKTEQDYKDEMSGASGTGHYGNGAVAKALNALLKKQNAEYAEALAEGAEIAKQMDKLRAEQQDLHAGSPAYEALEDTKEARAAKAQSVMPSGWLAQEHAFHAFQAANRGDFAVTWFPWFIRGLLILIDLLPLSLKLATGSTLYGRRLRDRAERIRYADHVMHDIRLNDIQRATDLHDYRTGFATRLAFERDEKYLRTRTDHLHQRDDRREEQK